LVCRPRGHGLLTEGPGPPYVSVRVKPSSTVQLPPGAYLLSRDVRNPRPDRRQRHDWRVEESWKEGRRFVVKTNSYGDHGTILACVASNCQYTTQDLVEGDPAWGVLVPALVPDPDPVRSLNARVIQEHGQRLRDLAGPAMTVLLDDGIVSPDAFMNLVDEYWRRVEAEG